MNNLKNIITGGIITLVIGGTAFTFNQQAVVDNFAEDTGFTQEQAEQYVNNVSEDELVPFDEIGADYVAEGEETLEFATSIDCVNYEYEWESATLSCSTGKAQLQEIGNAEQSLGREYIKLGSDSASENDMRTAVGLLDQLNSFYSLEVSVAAFDNQILNEMRLTNSYNKSLLNAALESKGKK
ncbi:MAG: hypothetical protein Q7S96_04310 [bacterium]|nr:hypothetical protein [bacterium]